MELQPLNRCQRCHTPYDWRRSTSHSLKMTYCSALCEKGALGFTIESLLATVDMTPAPTATAHEAEEALQAAESVLAA
ncbi:MAG: hypothetical protein Kow0010_19090 [Dehalococcoidia bacterium]